LLAKEKGSEDRARAEKFLKKVVEVNSTDIEAWIELAEIQEKTDIKEALKCKKKKTF
jgi:hypothetical protein